LKTKDGGRIDRRTRRMGLCDKEDSRKMWVITNEFYSASLYMAAARPKRAVRFLRRDNKSVKGEGYSRVSKWTKGKYSHQVVTLEKSFGFPIPLQTRTCVLHEERETRWTCVEEAIRKSVEVNYILACVCVCARAHYDEIID